ncbi:hypothetical protein COEREDRAFT_79690 [Coemansia reversa NRRL 1564]|uniref:Uncharacterized protein n=1 Tax=Coemansia reversa (strain ATCC 12441 / NRRL 1564) TaxID=763665 RepID=A0A2G5BI32_COERN|nr:hypothetical protein COEREDRAFT_79690 [Coemansia reversa NRRL 1564]|eukprot:PIA18688.1 hypothetical protein COEREDRAFT_79690 [Coemansia reversa NRRL 1564]
MALPGGEPLTENSEIQGLMNTINSLVKTERRVPPQEMDFSGDIATRVPPGEDRIDRLGESVMQVGVELDTIKQMIKDLQALASAQTRLSTTIYHRQEETRNALVGLESQHSESKQMLKQLEQHIQAIYQFSASQQQQQQQQAQRMATSMHASPSPVDIQRSILATNALASSAEGNSQVASATLSAPYGSASNISRAADTTALNRRQYIWSATPPQSGTALALASPSMSEGGTEHIRRALSQHSAPEPTLSQRQLALQRILQHPQAQNLTSQQLNQLLAHSSPGLPPTSLMAQQQQSQQRVLQQTSQPQSAYLESQPTPISQQLQSQQLAQQQQLVQQMVQQQQLAQQQQQLQSQELDKRNQKAQQQQHLREQLRLQKQQKDRESIPFKDSPSQPLSKLPSNNDNAFQVHVADGNVLTPPENTQPAKVDSTQTLANISSAPIADEHSVDVANTSIQAASVPSEPVQMVSTPDRSAMASVTPIAKKNPMISPSANMLPVSLIKSTPPSQTKKTAAIAAATPLVESPSRNTLPAKPTSAARPTDHPAAPSVMHAASKPHPKYSTTPKQPQNPSHIVKQEHGKPGNLTPAGRPKPPGKMPAVLSEVRRSSLQKEQSPPLQFKKDPLPTHPVGGKYGDGAEPVSPELGSLSPGSKALSFSANSSTRLHGHSNRRSRTPDSRSCSQSSFDSRHGEANGSSSEMTIKGSTKHRLSNDQHEHNRTKRRQLSPRASNNVIRFSDNEDDGNSSDSMICMDTEENIERNSNESCSPRRSRHGEVAIGIVGTSGMNITSRLGPRSSTYRSNLDERLGSSYSYDSHVPSYLESRDASAGYSSSVSSRRPTAIPLKDNSGQDITSERISSLLGPFVFLELSVMQKVYAMYFGCQPLVSGVGLHTLHVTMTKLNNFRFKEIRSLNASGGQSRFKFIARSGEGLRKAKSRIEYRLLECEVIPAPLLWCFIIQLGCFTIDDLSGSAVDYMFYEVTGKHLNRLKIVTADGVMHMSADEIWRMARHWATDVTNFVTEGRRAPESLGIAEEIFGSYLKKCRENGLSAPKQDRGDIAEKMFREHKHSQLFLGVRSGELKSLFKYLGYMMGKRVDRAAMNYLRETSTSFIRNN